MSMRKVKCAFRDQEGRIAQPDIATGGLKQHRHGRSGECSSPDEPVLTRGNGRSGDTGFDVDPGEGLWMLSLLRRHARRNENCCGESERVNPAELRAASIVAVMTEGVHASESA